MRPDNWAICHRCKDKFDAEYRELEEKLKTAYGRVSEEEYLELKLKVSFVPDKPMSLAEYYEIGIGGREFFCTYKANCEICGFIFEFNHKEKVL